MIYQGWTPDTVLQMRAVMFFRMLQKGRMFEHRNRHRHYFEMCRVTLYPNLNEESKKELLQWHWDQSMTMWDRAVQEDVKEMMEEKAQNYLPSSAALDFFRTSSRRQ